MDDTQRTQLIFEFNGGEITVSQPTEGQLFTLTALHRDGNDTAGHMKVIRRMFRVVEHLVSEEAYEGIEEAMISGEVTPLEVVGLIESIFSTDWTAAAAPEPAAPAPVPMPTPAAVRKAPRPA